MDLFKKLGWVGRGGKKSERWEEVVVIYPARYEDIRMKARQLGALLDRSILAAVEADNSDILRYVVNRLIRIRRCVDAYIIEEVKNGNGMAIEKAMRNLLLNNWEGPIVKFLEEKKQLIVNKGEEALEDFVKQYRNWVDPNIQVLAFGGDIEGKRMTANQIHYKT